MAVVTGPCAATLAATVVCGQERETNLHTLMEPLHRRACEQPAVRACTEVGGAAQKRRTPPTLRFRARWC